MTLSQRIGTLWPWQESSPPTGVEAIGAAQREIETLALLERALPGAYTLRKQQQACFFQALSSNFSTTGVPRWGIVGLCS